MSVGTTSGGCEETGENARERETLLREQVWWPLVHLTNTIGDLRHFVKCPVSLAPTFGLSFVVLVAKPVPKSIFTNTYGPFSSSGHLSNSKKYLNKI